MGMEKGKRQTEKEKKVEVKMRLRNWSEKFEK